MSSSEVAISVRGLSKAYTIAHEQEKQSTLAETLLQRMRHPRQSRSREVFWALRDVSFQINKGDVVGIVGRNGAGKSTLLKILSRITEPTAGEIDLYGRIGSLLEVGTGFHPELTGRENVFLNGAILGMSKGEIRRQFDAIVEFAEVSKFLDTPVKRYSSGMYVRLAFAVAAHLGSEILIVDEVLAVGDVEFQKKCLGKMKDVADVGRTVVFVSHQMNAVRTLCNKAVLMEKGRVTSVDTTEKVINRYMQSVDMTTAWTNEGAQYDDPAFTPKRLALVECETRSVVSGPVGCNAEIGVEIEGEVFKPHPSLCVGFALFSLNGELLFWSYHVDSSTGQPEVLQAGRHQFFVRLPRHILNAGIYKIEMIASLHYIRWILEPDVKAPAISFEVEGDFSDSALWIARRPGVLAPLLPFEAAALDQR